MTIFTNYNARKLIPETVYTKCEQFAINSYTTSTDYYYFNRGQSNSSKIKEDILIGKIAEMLVFQQLKKDFPAISKPDFQIYQANQKTFGPDLSFSTFDIQVKACRSNSFEPSWLFQCKDVDYTVKTNKPLYEAFCTIDLEKRLAIIKAIVSHEYLLKNECFKNPHCTRFIGEKYAVYYSDLISNIDEIPIS